MRRINARASGKGEEDSEGALRSGAREAPELRQRVRCVSPPTLREFMSAVDARSASALGKTATAPYGETLARRRRRNTQS